MVYGTRLESERALKGTGGSNPPVSSLLFFETCIIGGDSKESRGKSLPVRLPAAAYLVMRLDAANDW